MSCTEFHHGKAKKIEFSGDLTLQEKVDELKNRGFQFDYEYVEDNDIYCKNLAYMYESGDFYELLEHSKSNDEQDLAIATKNDDGTINFTLQFYNGGCGFEEQFEEAVNKL